MKKAATILFTLILVISLPGYPQIKVLFLGNSQFGVYGIKGSRMYDLASMIKDLSESAPAGQPLIEPALKLVGGASLKKLWDLGEAPGTPREMINSEKWDYVVLQEIFNAEEQEFITYATLFDDAVRKAGSKTILFATAGVTKYYNPPQPHFPEGFLKLNNMQISFGKQKGIPVVAAGHAWIKYLGPNPSDEELLDLYAKDKGHPGYKGSYIYACCLYAAITGRKPAGVTNKFMNPVNKEAVMIPEREAAKMQKVAWQQYKMNRRKR